MATTCEQLIVQNGFRPLPSSRMRFHANLGTNCAVSRRIPLFPQCRHCAAGLVNFQGCDLYVVVQIRSPRGPLVLSRLGVSLSPGERVDIILVVVRKVT